MSTNINNYKLYQMVEYLNTNYNYQAIYIKNNNKKDEIWLVNKDNPNYKVIRISLESIELVNYDIERKELILKHLSSRLMQECTFLDILIGENVLANEHFNTISIDENYYDGIDLSNVFPDIKNVIHNVEDKQKDINMRLLNINNHSMNLNRNRRKRAFLGSESKATNIIIVVCFIIFTIYLILSNIIGSSNAHIILGADYKMFTLGLKQLYRLVTVAFCHASVTHVLMNMFSLSIVGPYIDKKYGTKFYLLTLFLSVLCGSLTNGILTPNSLSVGISGGIYGLMVIYLINAFKMKSYNLTSFIYLISVNLMINLLGNVSWQAHLGGAVCGLVMYLIAESNYKQFAKALLVILLLTLGYKYLSIETITPKFVQTDTEVINVYRNIGLKNYASNLEKRLLEAYSKYK